MTRSSTRRSARLPPPQPRVQDLVEGVAEEVEPEHEEDDAQARDDQPRRVADAEGAVVDRLGDVLTPAHGWRRGVAQERVATPRGGLEPHGHVSCLRIQWVRVWV